MANTFQPDATPDTSGKIAAIDPDGVIHLNEPASCLERPGWSKAVLAINSKGELKHVHKDLLSSEWRPATLQEMGPGPLLGMSSGRKRRELTKEDLTRTRIGLSYRECSVDKISDVEIRKLVGKYIKNISQMLESCTGLLITGDSGVGKSAIAALIAMEALRWGHSVYVATHDEMQELRFDAKAEYSVDGEPLSHRVKNVDLLVLDNFNSDFSSDKIFGPSRMEKLISLRNAARKTTILTTRFCSDDFSSDPALKSLYGVTKETMVGVFLEGVDMRQSRNNEMRQRLGLI